jgi:hypothetical protein
MWNQRTFSCLGLLLLAVCCAGGVQAQQKCPLPPAVSAASGTNIFQPQQETVLGDLMAEQMDQRYQVLDAPDLTAYLDRVASRLLSQLPPTGLRFQIILIDTPMVDAFSTAGGRIYVTRKMVAFLRNEDELAGLLGHEIGHIVTHQPAIEMTVLFQQVLGVRQISTREDIANKYNQLLDNAARGNGTYQKLAREEEPDQLIADQVAVYSTAGAGYSPQAILQFFDRLTKTHGKTGGFFSDWFGLTTPEEKRLREMQRNLAALPSACAGTSIASASAEFQKWQNDVIGFSSLNRKETLPGLLSKRALEPALRGDITYVRFSPDGQYVLAQDESSIFVLTREPFALQFRIDAPDAQFASFTPDSKNIVFSTHGLRVEDWSIADESRTSVHELAVQGGCIQSRLAPDGKTLACLTEKTRVSGVLPLLYMDLQIYDVASGEAIFTKKEFVAPVIENLLLILVMELREINGIDLIPIGYSPDGRYFAGASTNTTLAVDLISRAPIPLHGSLNDMLKGGFAFLDSDRVIAVNKSNPAKSAILGFPSGEMIKPVALGIQTIDASTQGGHAFLRPVMNGQVGVMDLTTGKGILALRQSSAIDVYDQDYIAENSSGEIGLFNLGNLNPETLVQFPVSPLGSLRAQAVSPDFRWLAVSGDTRGAVWDLASMKRLYFLRGFRGAFFDGNSAAYIDFPKSREVGRTIGRADLTSPKVDSAVAMEENSRATQYGPYLVTFRPNHKNIFLNQDVTFEVADSRSGMILWTMNFPKEAPAVSIISNENRVILFWRATTDSARAEFKKNEALGKQFSAMKDQSGVFLLQVFEAGTGHILGSVLVDTGKGSFKPEGAYSSGDWLLVTDDQNRTLVYSIADGAMKGAVFGRRSILSSAAGLLASENEAGQLQMYGLPNLEKRSLVGLSSPIALDRFSPDGKRLFVLTNAQNAYVFDTTALAQPDSISTNAH